MADYTTPTGGGGTLLIRDTGGNVEFWLGQSFSATYSGGIPWSGVINGVGVGGSFPWATGGGWRMVASYYVGSSQTVSFSIGATGTSGFGGPTGLSAYISRATVPSAPAAPVASAIGVDRMTLSWSIPSNGGAGIDQMLLRRWDSPGFGGAYTDYVNGGSTTSRLVTGLTPGKQYWWALYAHNAVGYSARGGGISATTLSPAYVGKGGAFPTAAGISVGAGGAIVPAAQVLVAKAGAFVQAG